MNLWEVPDLGRYPALSGGSLLFPQQTLHAIEERVLLVAIEKVETEKALNS